MDYVWNMDGIFMEYVWIVHGMYMNMSEYAWNTAGIKNIYGI